MYKVLFKYGSLTNQEKMGMEVIVYHPEKSIDGTHISGSSVFCANMLKGINSEGIDALINSLIPSLEKCMEEVDRRKKLESR